MTKPVVTRFAPSPTGFLHIGGARTALFNWLYAKAQGGTMLLRIEDTDRKRSQPEAIDAILDGLSWLELEWDGAPVYQHTLQDRHREIAERLLAEGKAYKCFCTAEELVQMREQARAEGRPPIYDGRWRERDPSDAPEGVQPTIRFKGPNAGETVIEDAVQGPVVFANKELDDLILLRSDGTPTYMLSVVVDDHDMGISHVIRGDDHLTNAARQSQIFAALDWDIPAWAHVPLIHGPDGAKLSKRHGALGIEAYRDMGYLPVALRNYLVRLGWSHGDDEIISTEDLIAWFDLSGIGRAAARFDLAKLENLNSHYISRISDDSLIQNIKNLPRAIIEKSGLKDGAGDWEKLERGLPVLRSRAKTLIEVLDAAQFLFSERPLQPNEQANKLLTNQSVMALGELLTRLKALDTWEAPAIEDVVREFAEDKALKLGDIAQPLRAALTGTTKSPGIFDVLVLLGRDESLGRIGDRL